MRWLVWLWRYFQPHVYAVVACVAFMFAVRWVTSLSGSCRFFCYPPVTLSLGVVSGLLGAQMYRSGNPVRVGR